MMWPFRGPAASTPGRNLAYRLVTAATAMMPAPRRDWGRAISAELASSTSRAERTRLVLAAMRIVVLAPPRLSAGLREYARAAGHAAVLALIAYVPIGLVLYLFTMVLPSAQVVIPGVLSYGYPLLVLLTAGARARRASATIGAPVIAGLTAGVMMAVLAVATVAVMDNAFFSIVSQQPDTVEKFRASGMASMHSYLNGGLESAAPVVIIVLAIAGAVFGPLGPVLAATFIPGRRKTALARTRMPAVLALHYCSGPRWSWLESTDMLGAFLRSSGASSPLTKQ
jgi:hypothetical protein